jgi:hypothetical protein
VPLLELKAYLDVYPAAGLDSSKPWDHNTSINALGTIGKTRLEKK